MRDISSLLLKAATGLACLAPPGAHAAITLTNLFSFGSNYTNSDGLNPSSGLTQARDGSFYGVTPNGGAAGYGMVFKITTNGVYTPLVSFGGTNGANPTAVLVQAADGNLYGTATYGGTYDLGTVFKVTPAGVLTTLAVFDGTNGANPAASLLLATNGALYGTAQYGGANDADFGGDGTVFRITTNGVLTPLYSFADANDGANPVAALTQAKDGNFYGATPYGGADFSGTFFRITAAGSLTTLYTFTGAGDGAVPDAQLLQGKDGGLYGTTAFGGTNDVDAGGDGTVFRITTQGALTRLVSFNDTNGNDPEAGLIQGPDGILYGTTTYGGLNRDGTVFRVTTNGLFTSLISFNGVNGAQPQANLALGTDGSLYGTTVNSGLDNVPGGYGTIFKMSTNGALSTLYLFGDNNPNGSTPAARLAQGPDGSFYGTTIYGGTNHGNCGTVFRLGTNGSFSLLAAFSGANGAYPRAGLTLAADGNFYGTTAYGGAYDPGKGGDGTVFRISANGNLITLASFNSTNGANPAADLALAPDGSLYGTARNGGTNNLATGGDGVVFRVTTNGLLTTLVSLSATNGSHPAAGLVQGPDGSFYGTAAYGGTNNLASGGNGTIFKVTTNGVLTRFVSFNGANGANPVGPLVLGTNGSFYGTTYYGGTAGAGTLFTLSTNGALTTLHSFSGAGDGANPASGLVLGADGNFYGTTAQGGAAYSGAAFQITHSGAFTLVCSFTGGAGSTPAAGLIEGAPSHFYGTTELGGTNDLGVLFQLFIDPFPSITQQPASLAQFAGTTATFFVSALGAAPLSYRWQRSATNLIDQANISGSGTAALTLSNIALTDAGSYSVIISNAAGAVTSAPASLVVMNPSAPTVLTEPATSVGISNATLNALVYPDGGSTTAWFQWGSAASYGNTTPLTNIGSGGVSLPVSLAISGLAPFTAYHYSAIAANPLGTNVGDDAFFITAGARSNVTLTPLLSFGATNGSSPVAGLLSAGTNLYGTTYDGGAYDDGTVFKLATNGALTVLLSFNGANGSHPSTGLIQTPNGILYGTTYDGGANDLATGGDGTVFRITTNGAFTSLVSFSVTNGANPVGELMLGADGQFYGTTYAGGANDLTNGGDGTIFRTTTNGVLVSLFSFGGTNGASPAAGLAAGRDGNLYGTTSAGGPGDAGTIFTLTTNGAFTLLYSFSGGDDGADPEAGLVQAADGSFYGTTFGGGSGGCGTVFKVTTSGILTTLYSFTGDTDGSGPSGTLLLAADGNLYGTTSGGGPGGYGTAFVITPAGALATLVLFDSDSYGANPQGALALAPDDSFYGSASAGGADGFGTVFRFRFAPFPAILVEPVNQTNFAGGSVMFSVAATGAAPLGYSWHRGAAKLADSANVFGSATSTLILSNIALADAGAYSVVVSNSSGAATSAVADLVVLNPFPPAVTTQPASAVGISRATLNAIINPDGAPTTAWFLFGITTNYGLSSPPTNLAAGGAPVSIEADVVGLAPFTLYHFAPVATNLQGATAGVDLTFMTPGARSNIMFTPLLSFGGDNGAGPQAALIQAPDGAFYGTTYDGGDNDLGSVFKITGDGSLTTLYSFDGTTGSHPAAALLPGAGGWLYGTTYDGGANDAAAGGDGTVFAISTNGLFTSLVSFNFTNGAGPAAALTPGPDGQFYGTTVAGGTHDVATGGDGTVFKVAADGTLTTLASFNGLNGANPAAPLTLGSDGNFYGTTENGGTNDLLSGGDGTIFSITTHGVLTSLFSFDGANGANPVAALAAGADGAFYGTTFAGGTNQLAAGGVGTIFRFTASGGLASVYSFTGGIDGANPQAGLLLATDGYFYGTTSGGGFNDQGTVFQFAPGAGLTTLALFDFDSYGSYPSAGLIEGADGNFYGVAASGGDNLDGTVFGFGLLPSPPVFQSLTQNAGGLTLAWSASMGRTYQLQYRTNLNQTNWINLASVVATNSSASAADAIDLSAQRFYRVLLLR